MTGYTVYLIGEVSQFRDHVAVQTLETISSMLIFQNLLSEINVTSLTEIVIVISLDFKAHGIVATCTFNPCMAMLALKPFIIRWIMREAMATAAETRGCIQVHLSTWAVTYLTPNIRVFKVTSLYLETSRMTG
jgi:hypothetical protein